MRISLAIPRPPEGACPCCYTKWVLREVESLALECLRCAKLIVIHGPALVAWAALVGLINQAGPRRCTGRAQKGH